METSTICSGYKPQIVPTLLGSRRTSKLGLAADLLSNDLGVNDTKDGTCPI